MSINEAHVAAAAAHVAAAAAQDMVADAAAACEAAASAAAACANSIADAAAAEYKTNSEQRLVGYDTYEQLTLGWPGCSFKQLVNAEKTDVYIRNYLIKTNMERSDVVHNMLWAANAGHKIAVIMQGLPGSGKSSIVSVLIESLSVSGVTCEQFCTDDLFINGYDRSKLTEHHDTNYRLFCESNAMVKFNENTNLKQWEYAKYAKYARDNGYIVFVLTMRERDFDVLAVRNIHNVSKEHLMRMAKKMKSAVPMYYGLFTLAPLGATIKTPLHVTCKYIGGKSNRDNFDWYVNNHPGQMYQLKVLGISNNVAGSAVVVESPIDNDAAIAHITIKVNKGFRPVDVGINIDMNTLNHGTAGTIITAIFSVMF